MSIHAAPSTPGRHLNLASPLFERAADDPSHAALWVDGESYSYGELSARAGRIAGWLAHTGVGPGSRVGVLGSRSAWTYAAILGSCWAGATYVPLSPRYPEARLVQLLQRAELDALVVDAAGEAALSAAVVEACPSARLAPHESGGEGVCLGPEALRAVEVLAEPRSMSPDDLAYLMFTSGTTGTPKGVMVSAGNVAHLLGVLRERYRLGREDRFSQFFELSFDLSVFDLFMAWGAGATLFCVPDTARMTPARYIREHALTVWFSVPSTAAFMLRVKSLEPGALPSLRLSIFCGEPLPAECAQRWREAAPDSRVENLYGPTEATVACLLAPCSEEVPTTPGRGIVAIGRPFPGTRAAIVDAEGGFLPAGESGELALAGAQVTPGYWRDPKLTAERYPVLDHPEHGPGVWYLTGDLARQDPDGDFHHLGRLDHQVKIQGHRVELEEIEAHLRAVCGGEAGVVAWPRQLGSAQGTVAFVSGTSLSAADIPARLATRLPAYMIPRRVIELERLPLTPNGKLDRKALLARLEEEGKGADGPL